MKKELAKKIKELEQYLTTNRPAPSNEIVDTYNEFKGPDPRTGRMRGYTSCGSCLRRMLVEMCDALKIENKKRTEKARQTKLEKEKREKEAASSEKDCEQTSI